MEYQVEGYRTENFISTEYKQNYLARMLAGYDDETWNKLKAGRRRTYERAAANLLIDWKSFEEKMKEFDIGKQMEECQVEEFVKLLDLHPIRALRLAELLRTDASLIADRLEAAAAGPPVRDEAINITPKRPTLEAIRHMWRLNTDVDENFLNGQFNYASARWDHLYAIVSPEQSRVLTDKVKSAFDFDWEQDDAHEKFEERFAVVGSGYVLSDTIEALFRSAIRPWPEESWRGVEVGNVSFDETPSDLYRLFYLCKPVALDFDDMYGCGFFGITSPCGRFAMQFYLHKYELAAYQLVVEDLAIRTRPAGALSIRCGIPGVDNGVATTDEDAIAWFDMVSKALKREWSVYPGNNFEV